MMLHARLRRPDDDERWDQLCATATGATFLHTRRFLSYHGERFVDRSVIVEDGGQFVGVLPAALSPADQSLVISHPGSTYGGIVHAGALRGAAMMEALSVVRSALAEAGAKRLVYKAVPHIYHRAPAQDDLYALFRLGARRSRCDLSCTIDLAGRLPVSERRRRSARKAAKAGLRVECGPQHAPAVWHLLAENLQRRHGVQPVHTLDELVLLLQRFPVDIRVVAAMQGQVHVAGVVLFRGGPTLHAQYIAASEIGQELSALDMLFEQCIHDAAADGARFFDFGISTEAQGTILNEGLYRFKSEFGAGGVVHEFFELDL